MRKYDRDTITSAFQLSPLTEKIEKQWMYQLSGIPRCSTTMFLLLTTKTTV